MPKYGLRVGDHTIDHHGTDITKGERVRTRPTEGTEQRTGVVFGFSPCRLEDCSGVRVWVRWPDGTQTRPCSAGLMQIEPGLYEIQ